MRNPAALLRLGGSLIDQAVEFQKNYNGIRNQSFIYFHNSFARQYDHLFEKRIGLEILAEPSKVPIFVKKRNASENDAEIASAVYSATFFIYELKEMLPGGILYKQMKIEKNAVDRSKMIYDDIIDYLPNLNQDEKNGIVIRLEKINEKLSQKDKFQRKISTYFTAAIVKIKME